MQGGARAGSRSSSHGDACTRTRRIHGSGAWPPWSSRWRAVVGIKRAYEPPARGDGYRVLVDRLWPRGVRKEDRSLDAWAKDVAPSHALRRGFADDPRRWREVPLPQRRPAQAPAAGHAVGALA